MLRLTKQNEVLRYEKITKMCLFIKQKPFLYKDNTIFNEYVKLWCLLNAPWNNHCYQASNQIFNNACNQIFNNHDLRIKVLEFIFNRLYRSFATTNTICLVLLVHIAISNAFLEKYQMIKQACSYLSMDVHAILVTVL